MSKMIFHVLAFNIALLSQSSHADVLRVAISPWFFPVIFESETGMPDGLDVEIVTQIGEAIGVDIEFVVVDPLMLGKAVGTGEADMAISSIESRTYLRGYASTHVDPASISLVEYTHIPSAFVVAEETIRSAADLRGKAVASLSFSAARESLAIWKNDGHVARVRGFELERVLVDSLTRRDVDGILVTLPVALELAATASDEWHVVRAVLEEEEIQEPLSIIVPAGNGNGRTRTGAILSVLDQMRESGEIQRITDRWIRAVP